MNKNFSIDFRMGIEITDSYYRRNNHDKKRNIIIMIKKN